MPRPISAIVLPAVIIVLAVLELSVFFAIAADEFAATSPSLFTYFSAAISVAVQLAAGGLIAFRKALGRRIYAYGMPVLILASYVAASFQMSQPSPLPVGEVSPVAIALPLLLNLAIYGGIMFFLYRSVMSRWLLSDGAPDEATAEAASPPSPVLVFLNSLPGRLTFLFALVLLLVFVFKAPIEMLYFYLVAVPIMLVVRYWLKRRA